MCLAGETGVEVANSSAQPAIQFLFAEDQARYLLSVPEAKLDDLMKAAQNVGVPAQTLGQFGGDFVALADAFIPLTAVKDAFEAGLPKLVA
jgi:phosphoribosylformylglycinamidine synthase